MAIKDKLGVLPRVAAGELLELELGCGSNKQHPHAVGVDMLDLDGVDLVGDVFEVLSLLPNGSVQAIYSYHFIEHIPDLPRLVQELGRVARSGATVELVAPHFSNAYFYSDPTHRNTFGLYTFCYFADSSPFARAVPTYGHQPEFSIARVDLRFKSNRPFYGRHLLRRGMGLLFNSSTYMKEFYEENLSNLISCYEVRYVLERKPR